MSLGAPGFWWRTGGLARHLLAPIGAVIGAITLRRMAQAGGTVPVPVICIGNPTVGGAGKTPTALLLLEMLGATGARPVALLRGHGGAARTPTVVDPARHSAAEVGDEALLLARLAPTVVAGGDRLGGAQRARALGASHVVMDDGFQNPSLHKDVALLVVDGAVGVGNGAVLPAGPLRAPLAPQLAQADAVLLIGDGAAGDRVAAMAQAAGRPVLRGRLLPQPAAVAALRDGPVYAFAGIGRPEKFFASLAQAGLALAGTRAFADHQPYRPQDIAALLREAARHGARLVTTEKDAARLTGSAFDGLRDKISVVPATLALSDDGQALMRLVALAEARALARGAPRV